MDYFYQATEFSSLAEATQSELKCQKLSRYFNNESGE